MVLEQVLDWVDRVFGWVNHVLFLFELLSNFLYLPRSMPESEYLDEYSYKFSRFSNTDNNASDSFFFLTLICTESGLTGYELGIIFQRVNDQHSCTWKVGRGHNVERDLSRIILYKLCSFSRQTLHSYKLLTLWTTLSILNLTARKNQMPIKCWFGCIMSWLSDCRCW